MSETVAPAGAHRPAVGEHLRGRVSGHPACRSCGHQHRVSDYGKSNDGQAIDLAYDAACPECGCTASGFAYDREIADIADNRRLLRELVSDDDSGRITEPTFPRCLPDMGHGDASGVRRVVEGECLRGGRRELAPAWPGLLGWAGNLRDQLGRVLRAARLRRRGVGDPRSTDHGRGADPAESTGSERHLRSVVSR